VTMQAIGLLMMIDGPGTVFSYRVIPCLRKRKKFINPPPNMGFGTITCLKYPE
jgi:hypothetical protein